jgi:hypothetical protein
MEPRLSEAGSGDGFGLGRLSPYSDSTYGSTYGWKGSLLSPETGTDGGIELLRAAIVGGDSACGRTEGSVCQVGCCDCERGGGGPGTDGDPCRLSRPVDLSCWMTVAVI